MGDEAVNSRDLLRSFTAGVLLFALTLVGMAEMTGFETTIMGVQVGGHLRGGSIRMRVSEAKQIQTGTSPSARQSIQQVQDAVGSAQQSAQTAVTSVTTDPTVTTEPMVSGVVGGTSGAPPVDTSPQDPVVTGVVGGGSAGGSAGGTGPDTIEISARVINAQLSYQQATATAEPVPASLGDFEFARRDDTKFSVVAYGVPGVAYVLEATLDFQQWKPLARNYPDSNRVEFEVSRASEIHTGFLRVRALTPAGAETMSVGALSSAPPDSNGGREPVVTGIVGAGSN